MFGPYRAALVWYHRPVAGWVLATGTAVGLRYIVAGG